MLQLRNDIWLTFIFNRGLNLLMNKFNLTGDDSEHKEL